MQNQYSIYVASSLYHKFFHLSTETLNFWYFWVFLFYGIASRAESKGHFAVLDLKISVLDKVDTVYVYGVFTRQKREHDSRLCVFGHCYSVYEFIVLVAPRGFDRSVNTFKFGFDTCYALLTFGNKSSGVGGGSENEFCKSGIFLSGLIPAIELNIHSATAPKA